MTWTNEERVDTAEEMSGGIEWVCPNCKEGNTDLGTETAMPMCYACEKTFHWEEVE
jgi:uncharacterized protein (DUF983 family)